MSMEIFRTNDNRIIQLAGRKKIEKWTEEYPLTYVSYIREKFLSSYGSSEDQKKIDLYLEKIAEELGIPILLNYFKELKDEEVLTIVDKVSLMREKLPSFTPKIQKLISDTLDKSIKEIAIPKFSKYFKILSSIDRKFLKKEDMKNLDEEIITVLSTVENLSSKNKPLYKPLLPDILKLNTSPNKELQGLIKKLETNLKS